MNNEQLIMQAAHTIFNDDQIEELLINYGEVPLHSYAYWKARGFSVKSGQKAIIKTNLWKKKSKKKNDENPESSEESSGDVELRKDGFFLTPTSLFFIDQVEKTREVKDGFN